MDETNEAAHIDNLHQGQEHFRWRKENMYALSILKRAEAAIYTQEAHIAAHDAEIALREERIAHGDAHADAPAPDEHKKMVHDHAAVGERHRELLDAIREIEAHLPS